MSGPAITIEDVSLQLDKSGRYIEGKVEIVITLKNHSRTSTYYVLKRPRNIDYDKDSQTLSIGLCEKDSSRPFRSEQLAILPDTTYRWQYLLPLWMKKITRPSGSREIVDVLDISRVQRVICTVAFHTSPFGDEPSIKIAEFAARLSKI